MNTVGYFTGGAFTEEGFGSAFNTIAANDISATKAVSARRNRPGLRYVVADVAKLKLDWAPKADLETASPPCTGFSEAGDRKGLDDPESGTLLPWIDLIEARIKAGLGPRVIAVENVVDLAADRDAFLRLTTAFTGLGYRMTAMALDASRWLPQSRERLFLIAVSDDIACGVEAMSSLTATPWMTPRPLIDAHARLPHAVKARWFWLNMPEPPPRDVTLADIIDLTAPWDPDKARLALMTPAHRARLTTDKYLPGFRRRRHGAQKLEVRDDGLAGCVRKAKGGSSVQDLVGLRQSRKFTARESARLMGIRDSYVLPAVKGDALDLIGDGICPPVVRWVSAHVLEPMLVGGSR
jgi:DNA (cytosine-5)-methyltransferase 1